MAIENLKKKSLFKIDWSVSYSMTLFQPEEHTEESKSMLKEVVLGGDVWDLLDEIMIYMNNPMQYYEKQVQFVRVIQ